MFNSIHRKRAEAAEAELARTKAQLEAVQLAFLRVPQLVGIAREGRMNKFTFIRDGKLTVIEFMGTWDDDLDGWRKALLEG